MLLVDGPMRGEIGEAGRIVRQTQANANARCGLGGDVGRHAFQDMDHAEHGIGRLMLYGEVNVADHRSIGPVRLGQCRYRPLARDGADVVQDPAVVVPLLRDVLIESVLQRLIRRSASRHGQGEQRTGEADMMIGLSEVGDVEVRRHAALQRRSNDVRGQKIVALGGRGRHEPVIGQ